jgi:hypothetical protein
MTTPVSTIGDNPQRPGIRSDVYVPDQLIAGSLPLVTEPITLAAGTLPRGAVLGRQKDGAYVLSVKDAKDGSQRPIAILVDEADASAGPVSAGAYLMGEFNEAAVTFDASWNLTTLTPALREVSIFLKNPVTATDPA